MRRGLRVIAGEAKSLPLEVPDQAGIRPTTDAMREVLFASLGADVCGACFADLYAGSGAVGIEALSRGARCTVFVERDYRCTQVIASNVANTRLASRAVVLRRSLPAAWGEIAQAQGPFDIVFVDPPYNSSALPAFAERLVCEGEGLAPEGIVVLQHDRPEPVLSQPVPDKTKVFGQSRMDIYYVRDMTNTCERQGDE